MKKPLMTLLATGAFVGSMMVGGAASALAGEVTGNGDSTPIRGNVAASLCAFSGLEDDPMQRGTTQNWGAFAKGRGGDHSGVPGFACNPTRGIR